MMILWCHEPHSKDGLSYVKKRNGYWEVWFKGSHRATYRTRKLARCHIRVLKQSIDN